jgi:hypothetical protein
MRHPTLNSSQILVLELGFFAERIMLKWVTHWRQSTLISIEWDCGETNFGKFQNQIQALEPSHPTTLTQVPN